MGWTGSPGGKGVDGTIYRVGWEWMEGFTKGGGGVGRYARWEWNESRGSSSVSGVDGRVHQALGIHQVARVHQEGGGGHLRFHEM